MGNSIGTDPRLDPRLRAIFSAMPDSRALGDVQSREQLLAEAASAEAVAAREGMRAFMDACDTEEVAPSAGLAVTTRTFISEPDGNKIRVNFIRPEAGRALPCVYYIHGGGMQAMSCFDGIYRAWGRIIAAQGVAVVSTDKNI